MSLPGSALTYAERGWRVFPLHGIVNGRCTCGRLNCGSAGKHPLVRRGLHEATTDKTQIETWWRRWRNANVGLVTGEASGIVVVDIDLPRAFESLDTIFHKLPRTLTGLTGGGGVHLIYRCSEDTLGNSAGRLPGIDGNLPGIDLRSNGGYIVAPPSIHRSGRSYEWLNPNAGLKPAPEWLKQPERSFFELGDVIPVEFDGPGTAYGRAALDSALTSLRQAPVGQRNHTLNREAFALAQLVAGGELLESAVRESLFCTALSIGLEESESHQTIVSAFRAGLDSPRVAPHRCS